MKWLTNLFRDKQDEFEHLLRDKWDLSLKCKELESQIKILKEQLAEYKGELPKRIYEVCIENEFEGNAYLYTTLTADTPINDMDNRCVYFKKDGRVIALFYNIIYWKEA